MVKPSGKGRKKVEIKKIEDKVARYVTFSKRRSGVFKKANELATLCGVEVGVIVFSPGGRPYSFGHPGIDGVADRFLSNNLDSPDISDSLRSYRENVNELNEESANLMRQIEAAKTEREVLLDRIRTVTDDDGREMSVEEMKELVKQLKDLKLKADTRMAEIIGAGGLLPRCPLPGLGMLTISAFPAFCLPKCNDSMDPTTCLPSQFQVNFFYISLYLVAVAQGGHNAAIQAFGADQFDQSNPKEFRSRSSLFNWWYFAVCGAIVITLLTMTYVQDNIGWGLGFGIPCIAMGFGLVVFLLGSQIYRFYILKDKSQFTRIGRAFVTIARSWRVSDNKHPVTSEEVQEISSEVDQSTKLSHGCRHLYPVQEDNVPSVLVEEAKGVLQLLPIWATCLIYGVVFAQSSTFFTKQGSTMDRRIGPNLQVPPAVVQSLISTTIVVLIPIYDCVFVPIARKLSKIPSGITMLQRVGTGLLISVISMVVAALVEMKRLKTARDYGLVDLPTAVIPMSLWWLIPQYILFGISDVFTIVGLQEFFYDQMPEALRSLGLALFLSIIGIGSIISSFLVAMIDKTTGSTGDSWFSNNLNRAHLDYFYWLLAVLSSVQFCTYFYLARTYVYKNEGIA